MIALNFYRNLAFGTSVAEALESAVEDCRRGGGPIEPKMMDLFREAFDASEATWTREDTVNPAIAKAVENVGDAVCALRKDLDARGSDAVFCVAPNLYALGIRPIDGTGNVGCVFVRFAGASIGKPVEAVIETADLPYPARIIL